jgi:peptidoglycan/LPS O-acetylase OafA/YrhL
MRIRYLSYIALGIAAAFLIVATAVFPLDTVVELTLGVSIAMLVVSLGIAERFRQDATSVFVGLASAAVSAWMILASQLYSASTLDDVTFGSAIAVAVLALIGLTAHELTTERVVHRLEVRSREPEPVDGPRPSAA